MPDLRDLARNVRAFEEAVGTIGPRKAAERITAELQDRGPNWTGEFMNAWRIVPGDQDVPASIGRFPQDEVPPYNPATPIRPKVPPVSLGVRTRAVVFKDKTIFTIGNASNHRLVAMDIDPGRRRVGRLTADYGWFETYMQGGEFQRAINVSLSEALRRARS